MTVTKIEPPNWWVGMKWNKVQLMLYGENLNFINAKFNDERLSVTQIHHADNNNYAFIELYAHISLFWWD